MLRLSLDHFLNEHNISAYRLVKETEGKVARGSVFSMARGDSVKRVDLDNLQHIMAALVALTGKPVTLADLFEVDLPKVELRQSAAGTVYSNDEETNEVLDSVPDILARRAKAREGRVRE